MRIKEFESKNATHLFQEVSENSLRQIKDCTIEPLEINSNSTYQEVDGFGASFTDSSAYLIDKVLSQKDKEFVMEKLFHPDEGIGLSVIRNPMGASDYARKIYSYNDQPEGEVDLELKDFSIDHDQESILPLTKEALTLNTELKVFASPWSAPGWMKDSGKMVTGKLLQKFYPNYAHYFLKYIQEYEKSGVPIYAVTPQNEPLYEPDNYPGMEMFAYEQIDFVSNHLKPLFQKEAIQTKIIGYDHNWDRVDYAFDLLDRASDSFDGIAWHWYGGKAISQSRVQREFPEKEIHFTEGSGGEWIPEFEPAFSNLMRTGISILRNNSKSFILWNMALDENNGPAVPNFGNSTCRGLLKVIQVDSSYEFTLDYYGLAHFSKFIRPGAKRVASTKTNEIKQVSFQNKDQSIVIVLFNDSDQRHTFEINIDKQQNYICSMEAKSAKTIVFTVE